MNLQQTSYVIQINISDSLYTNYQIQTVNISMKSNPIANIPQTTIHRISSTFDLSIKTKTNFQRLGDCLSISTDLHAISLKISNQVLTQVGAMLDDSSTQSVQIEATTANIKSQSIVLSDFSVKENSGGNNNNAIGDYVINIKRQNSSCASQSQILYKNVTASISKCEFTIQIDSQKELLFNFFPNKKCKFAKTTTLEKLMREENHTPDTEEISQYGVLTMDQSARILIENQNCEFPSIGLWCKCEKLDHIRVYNQISRYLSANSTNKKCCFIGQQQTKYIYFAKISQGIPQLYYVTWQSSLTEDNRKSMKLVKKLDENEADLVFELGHNYLEFTLRRTEEGQSFKSPTRQITNQEISDKLESICFESPGFSSIKKQKDIEKQSLKQQCQYLRDKVLNQAEIISVMQLQIQKLTAELESLRISKSTDSRQRIQQPQQLFFMRSPSYLPNSSTPQVKYKKLSESDLYHSGFMSSSQNTNHKSNSRNTKDTKGISSSGGNSLHNSSGKQLDFKNVKNDRNNDNIEMAGQDPWDLIEIIE